MGWVLVLHACLFMDVSSESDKKKEKGDYVNHQITS